MNDLEQRKKLLRLKLKANLQRNARTAYLAVLPPDLRDYLQTCQFILSPELDDLMPYFWLFEKEARPSLFNATGYEYRQLSWAIEVFGAIAKFGSEYDDTPAWFYPKGNCPLFCCPLGWVRQNLEALFSIYDVNSIRKFVYEPESLCVITTDLAAGILIDHYCGYLPSDPNPEEIVYEVATWKAKRQNDCLRN